MKEEVNKPVLPGTVWTVRLPCLWTRLVSCHLIARSEKQDHTKGLWVSVTGAHDVVERLKGLWVSVTGAHDVVERRINWSLILNTQSTIKAILGQAEGARSLVQVTVCYVIQLQKHHYLYFRHRRFRPTYWTTGSKNFLKAFNALLSYSVWETGASNQQHHINSVTCLSISMC